MTPAFTASTVLSKCTCFAVPLAARQVDQVQLALLERGVASVAVRVDALNTDEILLNECLASFYLRLRRYSNC